MKDPINRSFCNLDITDIRNPREDCTNDPDYHQPHSGGPFFQSNWGTRGNFELLVPVGNRVKQYFRNNDDPQYRWSHLRDFVYNAPHNELGPSPSALTFIQSNYLGDGVHGNFEGVVRVQPPIASEPDYLDFWYLDSKTSQWHEFPFTADSVQISGLSGNPALLQGNWGARGNYEMLVPMGSVIKQYYRNNDDPTGPWHHLRDFGYPANPQRLGPTVAGLTFIQSNYLGDGTHGNFEVIARVKSPVVTQPDQLDFWWLDSKTSKWNGPFPLMADNTPVSGVTGDPVLLQSTWGRQGNFELLVPAGNVIQQYYRDNDNPTLPWHHVRDFGYRPSPGQLGPTVTDVTFIQSNFAGDGVHGNFEVIARVQPPIAAQGASLDFWFLDSKTSNWNGPFPILPDGVAIAGSNGL